jgi:ribosomal RNA-processing protein 17
MATVTIEEDYVPTLPQATRYRSTSADVEGDDAGEAEEAAKPKRVVPLMPASSKRAKDKAKAARKKDDITKNRSMETKAERKKGRALELTRRMGKAGRAMERDGKQRGLKGKGGRGGKGGGGRGGKSDRGKKR